MAAAPELSAGEVAYREGRARFRESDVADAIASFERAAQLMPNDPRVQNYLGKAYMRAGNVARGVRAYRRYLELAPNAPDRPVVERIIAREDGE